MSAYSSDHEVQILDSTLREGEQTQGVNFSVEDKLQIAQLLDDFGTDIIEVGHPMVSKKIEEAVRKIMHLELNATILSHNRMRREDIDKSIDVGADYVATFLGISPLHLKDKLKMTQEQALAQIVDVIEYARAHGLKVRYGPEDATRTGFEYLVTACNAAIDAGAERININDTLGIMNPAEFSQLITKLRQHIKPCIMDVHCHNDFGMAVANSIAAIQAGANCVHTTVNGLGERAGITDLAPFVAYASFKKGILTKDYAITKLPELSRFVEKASGIYVAPTASIIGENAFTHKSGTHTDGVLKNPATYEAISPEFVGRSRTIAIDRYTGRLAVQRKLEEFGIIATTEQLGMIITKIKTFGDEHKIVHETDILDIAEEVTGRKMVTIPKDVECLVQIQLEPNIYTTSVLRKLGSIRSIKKIFEIAGEYTLSVHMSSRDMEEVNDHIEEIRSIQGIMSTNTRFILKKYEGQNGNTS